MRLLITLSLQVSYILPATFHEVKVMLFYTKSIDLSKKEIDFFWDEIRNALAQQEGASSS